MTVGGDRWTAGNDGLKLLRLELPKPIAILNLRPIDKRPLTQEALAHLAAVPKIRTIRFHAGSVDDDAVKHLVAALVASGNGHDWVELSRVDVTDACIEHLQQLTALKRLKLSHTGVSADGLARLERALPDCEIHYTPRK